MKNIHMFPTKKPSRLFMCFGKLNIGDYIAKRKHPNVENQYIYITSDEQIKEMDWFYDIRKPDTPINRRFINTIMDENCKKIILTDRPTLIENGVQAIDDEFLEWFVKYPTYEEVYIIKQYKQVNQDNPITRGSTALMFSHYEIHLLKANKQMIDDWNLIYCKLNNRQIPTKEKPTQEIINEDFAGGLDIGQIIPKEETKQETLLGKTISKEVADKDSFEDVTKYKIERSYSEEEVLVLLHKRDAYNFKNYAQSLLDWKTPKEWFESFKNK